MVVRLIPSSGGGSAWKLDDKDPFRHWIAFQQIDLATAGDDAPTKTGNCRQSARHVRLIGGGVGYVNIADDVGWHRTLPLGRGTAGWNVGQRQGLPQTIPSGQPHALTRSRCGREGFD